MENVYKWWNIHPRSIKNEMDYDKCLKRWKYCNRIHSAKFAFDQSREDEVFEETKGCGDEMSICAVSLLIPPFRATIIGCNNCFYYSESDLLLSMTALFWLFYTYPCPNITHTPHVGLYPVRSLGWTGLWHWVGNYVVTWPGLSATRSLPCIRFVAVTFQSEEEVF